MKNWQMMIDIFNMVLGAVLIVLAILMIWHGWSFEIGNPETGFHLQFEQYPLKRFFVK